MPTQADIARAQAQFSEVTGGRKPGALESKYLTTTGKVPGPGDLEKFASSQAQQQQVNDTASQLLQIAASANAAGIAAANRQLDLAEESLRLNAARAERQDALLAQSLKQQAEFARSQIELSQAQFGLTKEAFGLQKERFQQEQEQSRLQDLLRPILLKQAGINSVTDENGNITGFELAPNPMQEKRDQIEEALLDRSLSALRGELPVDPSLIRGLQEQESGLRETLRRQLGPDFETSSPGIESLAEFGKRKNETLESARRGDITMAEQLGIARQGASSAELNQAVSRGLTITNPATQSNVSLPGVSFGQLPSVAQLFPQQNVSFPDSGLYNAGTGYAATGAQLQSLPLELQNRLDVARITGNSGGGSDIWGSILGAAASIGGAYLLATGGTGSHSSFKDIDEEQVDESKVLDLVKEMNLKKWVYKGDTESHIGPMAEDFHEAFGVGNEYTIHMADISGVSFSAIKALADRMEKGYTRVKIT